jgi:hypothetical protein
MKALGGVEFYFHSFLISALNGWKWSKLRPGCFNPGKELCDPLIRIFGGPQNHSRQFGKKKYLASAGILTPYHIAYNIKRRDLILKMSKCSEDFL